MTYDSAAADAGTPVPTDGWNGGARIRGCASTWCTWPQC